MEDANPYNGTVNFDNVLQSLQMVFVIMSSNTFSDLLYYTTDTDYLVAALCKGHMAHRRERRLIACSLCFRYYLHELVVDELGEPALF